MTPDPIEAVARALCEEDIRVKRKWDTTPERLEEMLPSAVDFAWHEYRASARAAIAAIPKVERVAEYGFQPLSGPIPEARISIIARAVRASLRSYGHRVAESTLPECIAGDVLRALTPEPDTIGYVDNTGGPR